MSAEGSLQWPELYTSGQRQELSSPQVLSVSLAYAVYSSLVIFFIPCGVFFNSAFDFQTMAVTCSMAAMFSVNIEVRVKVFVDLKGKTDKKKYKGKRINKNNRSSSYMKVLLISSSSVLLPDYAADQVLDKVQSRSFVCLCVVVPHLQQDHPLLSPLSKITQRLLLRRYTSTQLTEWLWSF